LVAAARAPFERRPAILDDIAAPNLYTLRGPRRTGKSTVLKQTIARLCRDGVDPRRICFFAADALSTFNDLINLFQAALQLFPDLGDTPRYFLIDEVTVVPEWQRGMKWLRDNTPLANHCVVATGSSARDVGAGTAYLAGRRGPDVGLDRLLLPLSFPEFVRCAGYALPDPTPLPFGAFYSDEGRAACQEALVHMGTLADAFESYLQVGGFPQAVADFRRTAQVSGGFLRDLWDVIRADLRAAGVGRPEQMLRLIERLSASLTGPINLRNLGQDLDVVHSTVGLWLNALADSYLILLLFQEGGGMPDPRKQRKAYPVDPLVAYLPARLSSGAETPDVSRLAEAVLAAALFRAVEGDAIDRFGRPERLYFFRTANGTEVDFVVPPDPRAAESKYVDTASKRAAAAMVANFGGGLVLTRSAVDISPGVTILPAALFCWLLEQKG
jgi:predicted AAA+ superfamily ATPase